MSTNQLHIKLSGPPNGLIRKTTFESKPTWDELATRIEALFQIPKGDLAVSYIDSDDDEVTLNSEDELQQFYAALTDDRVVRFTVRDLSAERKADSSNTSVASDVASLFTTISAVLSSHPELSENLRNVLTRASQAGLPGAFFPPGPPFHLGPHGPWGHFQPHGGRFWQRGFGFGAGPNRYAPPPGPPPHGPHGYGSRAHGQHGPPFGPEGHGPHGRGPHSPDMRGDEWHFVPTPGRGIGPGPHAHAHGEPPHKRGPPHGRHPPPPGPPPPPGDGSEGPSEDPSTPTVTAEVPENPPSRPRSRSPPPHGRRGGRHRDGPPEHPPFGPHRQRTEPPFSWFGEEHDAQAWPGPQGMMGPGGRGLPHGPNRPRPHTHGSWGGWSRGEGSYGPDRDDSWWD